ncbi:MAG: hypothetical protein RMI79_03705 [Nitrososphaerota archaeon]|nr:hypothetical protein [Nitrososphaerota archaeon]
MNNFRKHVRELIIVTLLLSLAVSIANAVLFVYLPLTTDFREDRMLVFKKGTNANVADLEGVIIVDLNGDRGISMMIHPSKRGITYYKDLVRIVNVNEDSFNIFFKVDDAFQEPVKEAHLILRNVDTSLVIRVIDLRRERGTYSSILLDAGREVSIDLRLSISSNTEGSGTALIQIVY